MCQTTILITKRRNLAFLKYFRSLPVFCVNQLLSIKTITKTRIRALKICKSEIEEFSEIREWQVFYDRKCFRISSKVWRVKCLPKISSSKELKILKSKKKWNSWNVKIGTNRDKSWNRLKMIKLYVFSENCEKVELFFVTRNRDFRFLWSETSNLNEWQQSWMFAKIREFVNPESLRS